MTTLGLSVMKLEKIIERLENWSRCLEDAGLNVRMSKTERLQLAENL